MWSLVISSIILLIQFLGAAFHLEIVALLLEAIITLVIYFFYRGKKTKDIPIVIIICLGLQNFVIGLGAHAFGNTSSNLAYLTQVTTLIVYLLTFFILLDNYKFEKLDFLWIILVVMLLMSIARNFSSSTLIGQINYFRNYTCFFCFFIIGKKYLSNEKVRDSYIKFLVNFAVLLSFIGLIFNFLPFSFFESLGLREVYIAKGASISSGSDFSGRFTTTIFFTSVKRIGSLMYEPINFGYFLLIPLIFSLLLLLRKKDFISLLKVIIIGLGFITTYAKGPLLLLLSLFICYILYFIFKNFKSFRKNQKVFFVALTFVCTLFITLFSLYYYNNIGTSTNTHFWAIQRTFINCLNKPFFGYGLGTGGNYGETGLGTLETGAESGLMSIIYQMGFIFALIFILIFIYIAFNIFTDNHKVSFLISFICVPLIILSIFQENTYTPQCLGMLMIIEGSYYHNKLRNCKKANNNFISKMIY